MADHIPAITLTDPHNQDAAPSPAQSPSKGPAQVHDSLQGRVDSGRHVVNGATGRSANSSKGGGVSSGKLVRSLSKTAPSSPSPAHSAAVGREELMNGAKADDQSMDPLTQHIMARTHQALQHSLTSSNSNRPSSSGKAHEPEETRQHGQSSAPAVREPPALQRTETHDHAQKELRKGVKAVSFLSKLMGSSKKKTAESEAGEEEDEASSNDRPEGNDAQVFALPVDRIGFSPRYPPPPSYIKVQSKHKKERDFDRLFLAQELGGTKRPRLERQNSSNKLRRKSIAVPDTDTVWAIEFSRDGRYLAVAGADTKVRVWAVIASPEDREKHQSQEAAANEASSVADGTAEHLSAPVFLRRPIREYDGHSATILDLSWSKNNFLLSSSMDKTVRLWHVSRSECLCTFKHNDIVPSISFHPKDDRFFLAGSLDSRLRLWSIPDKSVAFLTQVPDMITAVAFTPDGKSAMAGCLSGLCMFYETEGLKYQTQIHVRSTRGQNAKGSKITSIQAHYAAGGDVKILIASNDSRIRLYNFRDKNLELKYRGNENNSSQIRASLSDDGRYVICGSEDRKAYIWSLGPAEGEKRDKQPVEMFEAHDSTTTAVCFAPAKTRRLLGQSEDPVYDLCNPPPVTLRSRAERAESQTSSRAPTENGSLRHVRTDVDAKSDKPLESPAYLARSGHREGNIIVTADYMGKIKVFRQDCSFSKRARPEDSDRASLFTKRSGGKLSRNGSVMTRASQRSLPLEGRTSTSTARSSERILSWRQNIASTPSITDKDSTAQSSSKHTSRSTSPRKSVDRRSKALSTTSESPRKNGQPQSTSAATATEAAPVTQPLSEQQSPSDANPLQLQGGQSYMFWDTAVWKAHVAQQHEHRRQQQHEQDSPAPLPDASHLTVHPSEAATKTNPTEHSPHLTATDTRPGRLSKVPSYVSQLSDERTDGSSPSDTEDEEFDDAREDPEHKADGNEMTCQRCGGAAFAARREGRHRPHLVCTACGLEA